MPRLAARSPLTLREAAALTDVAMNACNLSGLTHDLPRIMDAVWDDVLAQQGGTQQANTHPLAVLWLQKMAELAGLPLGPDADDRIHQAFVWLRAHLAA